MMLDVPSKEHIKSHKPLVMYAAPQNDDILAQIMDHRKPPTREELLAKKWTEVKVDVCLERLVTCAHVTASRKQHSLVHVGASTVSLFCCSENVKHFSCQFMEHDFPLENIRSTNKWVVSSRRSQNIQVMEFGLLTASSRQRTSIICLRYEI